MGSCAISVHVLTGSGRLLSHADRLTEHIHTAAAASLEHLPLGDADVDVVVRDAPELVIPELGIGGLAPDAHTVLLTVDAAHDLFASAFDRELVAVLAHELHHVARHRGPGYGRTLFEALVTEGLADHFATEISRTPPPPWTVALTADERARLAQLAEEEYDSRRYVHRFWFFGDDERAIPRWAGYSLGFQLVGDFLERHPQASAGGLASAPAASFRTP